MLFATSTFLALTAGGLLCFWALPCEWRSTIVFPILNVAFLLIFTTGSELGFLAAFVVAGYILLCAMRWDKRFGLIAIFGVLFGFLYLRQYPFLYFLPYPDSFPFVLGLSYVFFRVIQLVIDMKSGDVPELPSPVHYLNYTCNYLMLLSGPIQRYQEFDTQTAKMASFKLTQVEARDAIQRVIIGFLKCGPIAAALFAVHGYFIATLDGQSSELSGSFWDFSVVGSACFYLIFLYFNFSGYTDIVIGIAKLFGLTPPENFNRPFAANNFIDLWQRWHMSLGNWMKLYVFNPVLTFLMRRIKAPQAAPYLSALAFFVTFLLLGYWHGTSNAFFLCGVMLGMGMALNKIYQVKLREWLGKPRYKALKKNYIYQQLSFGLTFSWLAYSIIGFWADWELITAIAASAGLVQLVGYLAVTIVAAAVGRSLLALTTYPISYLLKFGSSLQKQWLQFPLLSVATLFLIFFYNFWTTDAVGFVYEGF